MTGETFKAVSMKLPLNHPRTLWLTKPCQDTLEVVTPLETAPERIVLKRNRSGQWYRSRALILAMHGELPYKNARRIVMPSARKKPTSAKREYKSQRLELRLAPSAKKVI